MAKWSGKSKGNVTGYKIFVFTIKYFGLYFAYFLLSFVSFYFFLTSDKKSIRYYFRSIHRYSRLKTAYSIYCNFFSLGQMLIDKVAFLAGFRTRFTYSFEGEERLIAMANAGHGGILIGAHMGNWEIAGQLLERIDIPVNIVMLQAEHEKIQAYLGSVLSKQNMHIIPIREDFSHLERIQQALQRRELIAIHGDRFLPGTKTLTVNFMGQRAKFPSGPHYLASKLNVPVCYVITVKDSVSHYHFYASEPETYTYPAKLKERDEKLSEMVEKYVRFLEEKLTEYPLQWFNYHPFWENEK